MATHLERLTPQVRVSKGRGLFGRYHKDGPHGVDVSVRGLAFSHL